MDALLAFVVAAWISFVGSILLGMVNVAVIETSIVKGARHGIWLAIGGVIPEIPYTLLAIFGTSYVDLLTAYQSYIAVGVGVVFIGIGTYYIVNHPGSKIHTEGLEKQSSHLRSFFKGLMLAFANPQLIFFWSGILLLINTGSLNFIAQREVLIDFNADIWFSPRIAFAIGAMIGALAILLIYVRLATLYRERLLIIIGDKLSRVVGVIFIALGVFAILKTFVV